jgi:general secretion pathway protein C
LSGRWYYSSNDGMERVSGVLSSVWQALAQPERAQRVRQGFMLLLLVWAVVSLSELIWSFLPRSEVDVPSQISVLNPLESRSGNAAAEPVDVETMLSWNLFGVASEESAAPVVTATTTNASDREGIEKGARESRLELKLRGVIAATEDGLGHAIIEHRSAQAVYAIGDELPIGTKVTLAKVMPGGVVLDNGGTYELLRLFEDTVLLDQLPADRSHESLTNSTVVEKPVQAGSTEGGDTVAAAQNFRRQLYENPQSLAEVVRVTAIREDNMLKGYRVDPGKKSSQFTQLGFKAGDVVTSINGITLDNPGNTMQLYQLMRSASEAVFDLQRGGENLTLTVSLDGAPQDG